MLQRKPDMPHLKQGTCDFIFHKEMPVKKKKKGMYPKGLFISGLYSSSEVTTFSQRKTTKRTIHLWNHSQLSMLNSMVTFNIISIQLH